MRANSNTKKWRQTCRNDATHTHLAHEVGNDAVEARAFVPESLLAGAERPEVLGCLWHHVSAQLHLDAARVLPADVDVKEHARVGVRGGGGGGCEVTRRHREAAGGAGELAQHRAES